MPDDDADMVEAILATLGTPRSWWSFDVETRWQTTLDAKVLPALQAGCSDGAGP